MAHKIIILLLLTVISCGAEIVPKKDTNALPSSASNLSDCKVGLYNPQNIDQFLNMIHELPKPLELECILKSLKRPFSVNATSSTMSVQPAVSPKDPRIFIFKGNLILSFVTAGDGSLIFEFSEMQSDMRSVKGEILIPVVSSFKKSDAFSHINNMNKTSCSGCHSAERPEYQIDGVQVYSSKALKPSSSKNVPLQNLRNELYLCQYKKDSSRRCSILTALLSHGEVNQEYFPSEMPTLLDSF